MSAPEIDYLCVGVCMYDSDSGYCLGCGRPPLSVASPDQEVVIDEVSRYPVAVELLLDVPGEAPSEDA